MTGEEGVLGTTIRQSASCPAAASHVRYEVLGMSFLMAFLMYMERGAIGAAAPSIMREFKIDKITMGWAISAFNRNTPAEHSRVDAAELTLLPAAQIPARNGWKRAVPWRRILRDRNLRQLSTGYFCYGFVIWL